MSIAPFTAKNFNSYKFAMSSPRNKKAPSNRQSDEKGPKGCSNFNR